MATFLSKSKHFPFSPLPSSLPFPHLLSAQLSLLLWIRHTSATPISSESLELSPTPSPSSTPNWSLPASFFTPAATTAPAPFFTPAATTAPAPTSNSVPTSASEGLGPPRSVSPLFIAVIVIGSIGVICISIGLGMKLWRRYKRRRLPPSALYRQSIGVVGDGARVLRVGTPSAQMSPGPDTRGDRIGSGVLGAEGDFHAPVPQMRQTPTSDIQEGRR
ncbi:hypothetical protein C8T65DRAFT_736829 [Cerioporus squamosus]|nr:hypothetical protein C8T65DRAFT_736829 [Cerioporus squamosus]